LKAKEAIMSSPIHHPEDIDPAVIYAPPKKRNGMRRARRFSGDVAVMQLQLQLALDPEAVPEPPSTLRVTLAASAAARALWPTVLRLGIVAAVAAWGIILLPGAKKWGALLPDAKKWGAVVMAQEPMRKPGQQSRQASVQLRANLPPAELGANPAKLVQVDFAAMTPALNPEKLVGTNGPASPEPIAISAPSVPPPPSVSPPPR
jgi:hypothetical protein